METKYSIIATIPVQRKVKEKYRIVSHRLLIFEPWSKSHPVVAVMIKQLNVLTTRSSGLRIFHSGGLNRFSKRIFSWGCNKTGTSKVTIIVNTKKTTLCVLLAVFLLLIESLWLCFISHNIFCIKTTNTICNP